MISVSCFEAGFRESNVCFRGVIVIPCDGGLVNDCRSKAVTVERAIVICRQLHVLLVVLSLLSFL